MSNPRTRLSVRLRSATSACGIALAVSQAPLATAQAPPAVPPGEPGASSSVATLAVQVDKPGAAISPILNGAFFEDINYAADGGLYPERIKNGSFEFSPNPMLGWRRQERGGAVTSLSVGDDRPLNSRNPHYLRVSLENGDGELALFNEGFHGVGLSRGAKYTFSVYARTPEAGTPPPAVALELRDASGQKVLGAAELSGGFSAEWKKYEATVEPGATEERGQVALRFKGRGAIDLDAVSLFPQDTWGNRPRGLRPDLVRLIKDLKPAFLRFPGGCIVEGRFLSNRYQWKNTIGDVEQRKLIVNRWNDEFKHRLSPDYFQSFGLGFFEYFQLCEDVGAKPLPILNCGMACQYNSGELAPLDQLESYIRDALDLIEFANGPADSPWGRRRAEMGHPAPFGLTMLGVGNEQWGPQYIARYKPFAAALKAKHPEIALVAAAGPSPDGRDFDYLWGKFRELHADLVDEHFYRKPEWFTAQVHRYDGYDRNGPKVFAGEFAAQSVGSASPLNRNDWHCALCEAAFMTGVERNGDVVAMACYAPLLAHVDGWQWRPDLIWFDNLRSFGTPSYYVQKLFSTHRGSIILPGALEGATDGLFVCTSRDGQSGDVIVKAVNTRPEPRRLDLSLAGLGGPAAGGEVEVLASPDLAAENTLDAPTRVSPRAESLDLAAGAAGAAGDRFSRELPGYSLTVIRVHGAKGKS